MRSDKLRRYEGLVFSTSRMYEGILRVEMEDLQQVLRLRVWLALEAFDPGRSAATEESFVFTCVRNQIKDLMKARRRRDSLATEVYIEDVAPADHAVEFGGIRDRFEHKHLSDALDDVHADEVLLPATLVRAERHVIALLYVGYSQTEVAGLLNVPPREVWGHMTSIRRKMEDWRPNAGTSMSQGAEIVQLASEAMDALAQAA